MKIVIDNDIINKRSLMPDIIYVKYTYFSGLRFVNKSDTYSENCIYAMFDIIGEDNRVVCMGFPLSCNDEEFNECKSEYSDVLVRGAYYSEGVPAVLATTNFFKEKGQDEFCVYCANFENDKDSNLYAFSFTKKGLIIIMSILNRIINFEELTYSSADKLSIVISDDSKTKKINFRKSFVLEEFYIPEIGHIKFLKNEYNGIAILAINIDSEIYKILMPFKVDKKSAKKLKTHKLRKKNVEDINIKGSYTCLDDNEIVYLLDGKKLIDRIAVVGVKNGGSSFESIIFELTKMAYNDMRDSLFNGLRND